MLYQLCFNLARSLVIPENTHATTDPLHSHHSQGDPMPRVGSSRKQPADLRRTRSRQPAPRRTRRQP